jgi:hypothetical protein
MNMMILFDGKDYVVKPLVEGVHPEEIMEKHPSSVFLDHASSAPEAAVKIQRDRDRTKTVSI